MTDDLFAPEVIADPYGYFGHLRDTDPIHWNARSELWVITGYDDLVWLVRHPELFSSAVIGSDQRPPYHNGTHVDAPSHFGGRWSVDQIPADRLVRPGVCVAVTSQPDDYQISAADVKAWEAKNGPVPEGAIGDSPGGTRPQ